MSLNHYVIKADRHADLSLNCVHDNCFWYRNYMNDTAALGTMAMDALAHTEEKHRDD